MQSIEVRDYDDLGNCTAVTTTTPAGTPQVKYVYKYDEKTLAEDIFFYPNPEGDFPDYPQMHNMLTSYEFWALDQNGGGLVYVLDYLLNYEQIGEIGLSASINVEEEEKLASSFSVRSIPTLLFIPKNGKYRIVQGAIGKPQLKQAVDEILL